MWLLTPPKIAPTLMFSEDSKEISELYTIYKDPTELVGCSLIIVHGDKFTLESVILCHDNVSKLAAERFNFWELCDVHTVYCSYTHSR